MGFRSLPSLLIQTLDGLIKVRPRVLQVDTANMTLVESPPGTLTLGASGGGGGASPGTFDVTVANADASTMPKGAVVSWGSAVDAAGIMRVFFAGNGGGPTLGIPFGMMLASTAVGATGSCRLAGLVDGLDTHLFSAGDSVYCDTSGGTLTTTSTNGVFVGIVTISDATTGAIYVGGNIGNMSFPTTHDHEGYGDGGPLVRPLWFEFAPSSNPPSGYQTVYIDPSDHKLKRRNSTGTITIIG